MSPAPAVVAELIQKNRFLLHQAARLFNPHGAQSGVTGE